MHAASERSSAVWKFKELWEREYYAGLSFEQADDLLALNIALDRLEEMSSRQRQVVELRYFGGLSNEETAEVLKVSPITVKRDWVVARAWLKGQLAARESRQQICMTSEEWNRLFDLFHAAREKSGEERVMVLDAACGESTLFGGPSKSCCERTKPPMAF